MKLLGATEGSQRSRKQSESKRPSIKDDLDADFDQIGATYLSPKKKPVQGKTNNNPRD